jgi:hypothetical protein
VITYFIASPLVALRSARVYRRARYA